MPLSREYIRNELTNALTTRELSVGSLDAIAAAHRELANQSGEWVSGQINGSANWIAKQLSRQLQSLDVVGLDIQGGLKSPSTQPHIKNATDIIKLHFSRKTVDTPKPRDSINYAGLLGRKLCVDLEPFCLRIYADRGTVMAAGYVGRVGTNRYAAFGFGLRKNKEQKWWSLWTW